MKWFRVLAVALSFLLLVATVVGCGGPEPVTFPDENLEAAIRDALGKPAGDEIMATELANLTTLWALFSDVTDLTGLEYCINLTELNIYDNQIRDISAISSLTDLSQLRLNGNQISDISALSSLTKMVLLYLGENQISDISPLSSMTNLTLLDLDGNQISDISPISSLTNLDALSLNGNQISDISALSSLTSIITLRLSENQISDISPLVENSGLSAGDTVDLSGNPLSTTSMDVHIPKLEARGVNVEWTVPPPVSELRVHFIDVGQGDAILIDFGETEILIDGGGKSPGVVGYLNDYVDGALEVMIATHPHADHIGGLIAVLGAFEVREIWHNNDTSSSQTYAEFMVAVQSEGAEVQTGRRGDEISVGGLTLTILNPEALTGTTNNNSLVLSLSYGEVDFLFMGDAEKEAEGVMIAAGIVPDVEILKVGHHGSRTSSSQAFLALAKPEVAIYMAGAGNSYGHPHEETINRLCNIGAEIYGTDVHGTITVIVNESGYTLQLEYQIPPIDCGNGGGGGGPQPTGVQISHINYDGDVPLTESDEYVEITNLGDAPQDLAGWVLKDIDEGYPSFTFPSYILEPGESIRVYTNEIHLEWGGFSFGYGSAVWNNSSPDTAALYDAQGVEVSRKSY